MAGSRYPKIELGREGGLAPSEFRVSGRFITIVGAVIDGADAYFDNGVLSGKSKAEQGITFGPEVLRAMQGRRVLALWFAAAADESGKAGWLGLTVGEMRIDAAKKDGYRDVGAFQTKLMDAARGRVSVTQLKEAERKPLLALLAKKPELWANALRSFRDTVIAAIPEAASLGTAAAAAVDAAAATAAGPPEVDIGVESGFPPATLRAFGRELAIVGCTVQDGKAVWDNGLLSGKSKVEQGIAFGAEPARAMGGKRVAAVWVSVARREDGKPGWFGASMGEMRIDAAKKEGFRDLSAWTVKLNDAARGRVELWRLKPEEKTAVLGLLQAREDLWEACSENMRTASE
jgi:hypothetical protein